MQYGILVQFTENISHKKKKSELENASKLFLLFFDRMGEAVEIEKLP